jgi:arginyl-tRNA synthetase
MQKVIENIIEQAIAGAVQAGELDLAYTPEPAVERPRDPENGDWACTIALRLAKELGKPPRAIAEIIAAHIASDEAIAAVEIAGPGFINIRLSTAALQQVVRNAYEQGSNFGRSNIGGQRSINVEFISANPTGPMHVGHGRWAALGNAMCNVLEHAGWQVTREFYINDAGNQMEVFGNSIALRYLELCGQQIRIPEEFYGGSYVIDIARQILERDGRQWLEADEAQRNAEFQEFGYRSMLQQMQDICSGLGVNFDVWFSERRLYLPDAATGLSKVEAMLKTLEQHGYLYKFEDATWFRTTDFADDKDRVLIKADGNYTYFAPDIAYHLDKFERQSSDGKPTGSEYLINIWGADHHGYIPRMQAAVQALGHEGKLTVVLGQLVNLFRSGEAVRMSKRTGEMVTFAELIEEVGADATKYLMLSRSADQPIDFDIEVAKKQDSTNPVYYVQYAHARICSILRKAAEQSGKADSSKPTSTTDLTPLTHPAELDLARVLSQLSEVVEAAARDLAPFRLTHYAEQLATSFHSFYTKCQVLTGDQPTTAARLYLAEATRNVLALTLGLLGVSAPERM